MDSLIRQMRVRFANVGQENYSEEPGSSFKERRIPPQKTQSFKGEKKRDQNWFRRQFSRQMSGEFDPNAQMEHVTAVAAAVYAITTVEESHIPNQKKTSEVPQPSMSRLRSTKEDTSITLPEQKMTGDEPEPSLSRLKSKKEDAPIPSPEPGRVSKRFSGENVMGSLVSPDRKAPVTAAMDEKILEKAAIGSQPIKRTPTFADEQFRSSDTTKYKGTPSKVTDPGPSMTKAPTFADERLNRTSSKQPEEALPQFDLPASRPGRATSKSDIPPPIKPATPPTETKRHSSARPGTGETKADSWEKAELAKIKDRYEKLNETILSWENKKKQKARRKLDKAESELERRKLKALQKFHRDMESIDQIAGGARAQAHEKRRNEELKAKEKANIIRTTGKAPATCFCC